MGLPVPVHRAVARVPHRAGAQPDPGDFLARFEGSPRGFWGRGDRWVAWGEVLHEIWLEERPREGSRFDRIRHQVGRFQLADAWEPSTREAAPDPGTPDPLRPGAPPRFFGGFSFLDDPEPNGSWNAFPRARFVLPRVLLESGPEGTRVVVQRIGGGDEGTAAEEERTGQAQAQAQAQASALARDLAGDWAEERAEDWTGNRAENLAENRADDRAEDRGRPLPPGAAASLPEPEVSPDESAVERDEAGWTRAVEAVLQALREGEESRALAFAERDAAGPPLDPGADSGSEPGSDPGSDPHPATRLEKAVLARTRDVSLADPVSVPGLLRFLRHENRKAHVFVFEPEAGRVLFGAAPEILAELRGGRFRATAVAGSAPRGRTTHEEALFAGGLLASVKDREEHRMTLEEMVEVLTPRMRTLQVPPGPGVLTLARIQHLETPIEGEALPDQHVLGLVEALHPTPAVCGRPRGAALEMIRGVEPFERGWYAGPVGWVDPSGDGDFVPVLRAGVGGGRQWRLYAGAGIVEGSDPHSEWEETALKFEPAHRALRAGVVKG